MKNFYDENGNINIEKNENKKPKRKIEFKKIIAIIVITIVIIGTIGSFTKMNESVNEAMENLRNLFN